MKLQQRLVIIVVTVLTATLLAVAPSATASALVKATSDTDSELERISFGLNGTTHKLIAQNWTTSPVVVEYSDATYGNQRIVLAPHTDAPLCADPSYTAPGPISVLVTLHPDTASSETVTMTVGAISAEYLERAKAELRRATNVLRKAKSVLRAAKRQHQTAKIIKVKKRVQAATARVRFARSEVRRWQSEYDYCAERRLQ